MGRELVLSQFSGRDDLFHITSLLKPIHYRIFVGVNKHNRLFSRMNFTQQMCMLFWFWPIQITVPIVQKKTSEFSSFTVKRKFKLFWDFGCIFLIMSRHSVFSSHYFLSASQQNHSCLDNILKLNFFKYNEKKIHVYDDNLKQDAVSTIWM